MTKDFLKIFSSNLIKMCSTIIATFFLPKFLSIEDYAVIKSYQLYVSYIGVFSFGYNDGIFLKYGGQKFLEIDKKDVGKEQITIFAYQVILSALISFFAICQRDFIVAMVGLSFLPTTMFSYYTYMYQSTGEFNRYSRVMNINSWLVFAVNVLLVFCFKEECGNVYIFFYVITNYIIFLLNFVTFNRTMKVGHCLPALPIFIENVRQGILLMLGNLAYIFFVGVDKLFVKAFLGVESFARYSFAAQLLNVINMFITPLSLTLYNYFGKRKSNKFESYMRELLVVILFLMLIIVYFYRLIIQLFIQKYSAAIEILVILFLAQIFLTINTAIYVNLFKVYKRQKTYFRNLLVVVMLSIIANFVFMMIKKSELSIVYATLFCMIIWTILNLCSFRHTSFSKKEVFYITFCIALYISTSFRMEPLSGGVIYVLGFSVATLLFRHELLKRNA